MTSLEISAARPARARGGRGAAAHLKEVSRLFAHSRLHASPSAAHASISSVLRAMDVPYDFGVGTLRLSTGRHTTVEEVRKAAGLIIAEAKRQWADEDAATHDQKRAKCA